MTTPHMRAGHTDRQDAVDRLTRHFTEGRLDPTEFDERVAKAYAAIHLDQLPVLLEDLPEDQQRRVDRAPTPWNGPQRPQVRRPPPVLAIILGQALLFGSWWLVLYAGIALAAVVAFVKGYEEPTLTRTYGEQYLEYRRNVPGWWPRLTPWRA